MGGVGVTNRTAQDQNTDFPFARFTRYAINTDSDTISKSKLILKTQWLGGSVFWSSSNPSYSQYRIYTSYKQKYGELKPKTDFYIRYVVIPGGNPTGGKMSGAALPVDKNNYEAVKKYYNIKD